MKIEHIAMYVRDLEGAREFFEKYFKATANQKYHNASKNFSSYFLSFASGARLEIMHKPEIAEKMDGGICTGYAHLAFSVGSREKVNELTKELQADGYETANPPRVTGDGYYESCVIGFENNLIEITE